MTLQKLPQTVVFDLDGTLLNTLDDLAASVNHALLSTGLPLRERSEIRRFLGNGIRNLVQRSVPDGTPPEVFYRTFSAFQAHYLVHCLDLTAPYPGIVDTLRTLKDSGVKMAIVSNKYQPAVTELRERFFCDTIDVAIGEQPGIRRKPAPDTLFEALRLLGSDVSTTVYVGDSEVDLATARAANCPCISVLWGFRDRDDLLQNGATRLASDPAELLQQLAAVG